MQDLGEYLGYDSEPCPNCGSVRVEKYSCGKHICEKCHWCIEDKGYYIEEEPEYEGVTLDDLWRETRNELYESMFCGN